MIVRSLRRQIQLTVLLLFIAISYTSGQIDHIWSTIPAKWVAQAKVNEYDYEVRVNGSTGEAYTYTPALHLRYAVDDMWFGMEWEWNYQPPESLMIYFKIVGDVPAEQFPDRECLKKGNFTIVPPPSTVSSNSIWRFGKDRSGLFMLLDGQKVANFSSYNACLDEAQWVTMRGTHLMLKAVEKDATSVMYIRKVCKVSEDNCGPQKVECGAGYEHTDYLKTECRECMAGTYKSENMTTCAQCPEGSISSGNGASLCSECTGNTVTNDQQTQCECRTELETNVLYGNYTWPNVAVGTSGVLPCVHDVTENTTVNKFARKSCDGFFGLSETDFTECTYVLPMDTKGPIEDMADDIAVTLIVGKNISSEAATENLEKMDLLLAENEQDRQTFSPQPQLSAKTSEKFRGAAVSIVTSIVGGSLNSSTLGGTKSIGFAVADVQGTENKNSLSHSSEEGGEEVGSFSAELKTSEGLIATAVIYQSDKLFPSPTTTKVKISGSNEEKKEVFKDIATKFSSIENEADAEQAFSFVATMISDINIINKTSLDLTNSKLEENVEMKFEVTDFAKGVHSQTKRKTAVHSQLTCKFYNVSIQNWSEKGCETKLSYNEERGSYEVTCLCDHLTSFAVLMSMSSESNEAEEMASLILLGTSLVCLVLTLIATLPIKKQRKVEHVQVNMMLTLSLSLSIICFFLMDLFVSGDSESEASAPCTIIAFLLNYFWLCQLFWMVVEAITMYRALVKVFGTAVDKALLKYSIVGWGVPVLFPLIGLTWAKVTQYADPKTCFVRYPYGLASFYGPVVIAVLIIWGLFFSVARVIMRAMAAKSKQKGESDLAMRRRQLQSAFAVSTLLGLGWVVGFFLLMNNSNYSQINTALRWLFILLNAPQGIFIFVLYAVMNRKIRRYWISKITRGKYADYDTTSTGVSTSDYNSHGPRGSVALDNTNHLASPREGRPSLAPSPAVPRRRHSPCPVNRLAPGHPAPGRRTRSPSPAPNRKARNSHHEVE